MVFLNAHEDMNFKKYLKKLENALKNFKYSQIWKIFTTFFHNFEDFFIFKNVQEFNLCVQILKNNHKFEKKYEFKIISK